MPNLIERKLWLHSETDKAVLVSRTCIRHDAARIGGWLPKSQITIRSRDAVPNPEPGGVEILGTAISFTAPRWLLEKKSGMMEDGELL